MDKYKITMAEDDELFDNIIATTKETICNETDGCTVTNQWMYQYS